MVRKLRFHEQKLLKKVDFLQWKGDSTSREIEVMRRYRLQNREDYAKCARVRARVRVCVCRVRAMRLTRALCDRYNRLVGHVRALATKLAALKPDDKVRTTVTDQLLDKLCVGTCCW